MVSIVQQLFTNAAGTAPTSLGLEIGQIALNLPDRVLFIGDGTNAYTQIDGSVGTPPPGGKGFYAVSLSTSGGQFFKATTVTVAGAAPTTAELNTAFGSPSTLREGDLAVVETGPFQGIYIYDGTDWVADPNGKVQLTDVSAVADIPGVDAAVAAIKAGDGLNSGDVIVIANSTGLGAKSDFDGETFAQPPANFVEGTPISYIYTGSAFAVLGTPADGDQYVAGEGITFGTSGASVSVNLDWALAADLLPGDVVGTGTKALRNDFNRPVQNLVNVQGGAAVVVGAADQGGVIMRDLSVADENAAGAYKNVSVLSAGTF